MACETEHLLGVFGAERSRRVPYILTKGVDLAE